MQLTTSEDISEFLFNIARDIYDQKEKKVGPEIMRQIERWVGLSVIDSMWMDHLDAIDDLREGIGLRGYGQRDPLVEYKQEAFTMFEKLTETIDDEIVHRIYKVQVQIAPEQLQQMQKQQEELLKQAEMKKESISTFNKPSIISSSGVTASTNKPTDNQATKSKLGRNDPCWCGKVDSEGKPVKWKKCHYPQLSPD